MGHYWRRCDAAHESTHPPLLSRAHTHTRRHNERSRLVPVPTPLAACWLFARRAVPKIRAALPYNVALSPAPFRFFDFTFFVADKEGMGRGIEEHCGAATPERRLACVLRRSMRLWQAGDAMPPHHRSTSAAEPRSAGLRWFREFAIPMAPVAAPEWACCPPGCPYVRALPRRRPEISARSALSLLFAFLLF